MIKTYDNESSRVIFNLITVIRYLITFIVRLYGDCRRTRSGTCHEGFSGLATAFFQYQGVILGGSLGVFTGGCSKVAANYHKNSCFLNVFITRCGYRITGFIGAMLYCVGAFGANYGNSLIYLLVFTSLLKGAGYGLMQMLSISMLNVYFDKKLNFAMGISQSFIAIGTIGGAPLTIFLTRNLGIKNTIWLFTGLSLMNFPAMATFRPVPSCLNDVEVEVPSNEDTEIPQESTIIRSLPSAQVPLLPDDEEGNENTTRVWDTIKIWILDDMGFRLLNRLKFWNMTIGLAAAYTGDVIFYSLIRVTLNTLHYRPEDISFVLMILFVSDVIGRISYTVLSIFWTFKNRYVFLMANILINICRVLFFYRDDYHWKLLVVVLYGWLRAFIETLLPLVIIEGYKDNFPKALSMYHMSLVLVSFSSGPFVSLIKTYIGDDVMVAYIYTGIQYICCFTWLIEMIQCDKWNWFCRQAESH